MPPKQRLRWPRRRWYAPADACGLGQQGAMASRCAGLTRKGARCSITSTSRLADESGRLVAEPLQRGGAYCRFHARPFVTHSVGYCFALRDIPPTQLTFSRVSVRNGFCSGLAASDPRPTGGRADGRLRRPTGGRDGARLRRAYRRVLSRIEYLIPNR